MRYNFRPLGRNLLVFSARWLVFHSTLISLGFQRLNRENPFRVRVTSDAPIHAYFGNCMHPSTLRVQYFRLDIAPDS